MATKKQLKPVSVKSNTSANINKPKSKFYGKSKVLNDPILVAAFDTETEGLGGKLLSIQWGLMGDVFFDCSENMIENFINFILEYPSPFVWYAHFAQYDWRYIIDYIH